jgi:gamma-glutamyltranspeptidase/glutathione hydrolase
MINGEPPRAGEVFGFGDAAKTLEQIAQSQGESFYRGALADAIIRESRASGGLMTLEDLASHEPTWVDPIALDYRGITLLEIPPNGQGIAAQMALGMLEGLAIQEMEADSPDALHVQIEAMKLAFADGHRYIADPLSLDCEPARLLDRAYLAGAREADRSTACRLPHVWHAAAGWNGVSGRGGCFGNDGVVHPVELHGLWLGDRGAGRGHQPAEPRVRVCSGAGSSQLRRPAQAPLSHDHPGAGDARGKGGDGVWRDGRVDAAPGSRADDQPHLRLEAGPAGGRRWAAMACDR